MNRRAKPRVALALLLVACAVLAGCATVPTSTPARAVDGTETEQNTTVADPTNTTDPYEVPKQFVRASADPSNDHAAARAYLTKDAAKNWNTQGPLKVLDTEPDSTQVNVNNRDGIATLNMRANLLGTVQADGAFRAEPSNFSVPITLRRRADGQWRISDIPPGVVVPKQQFVVHYAQRTIYFYDPTMQALVPDPRWVRNEQSMRLANQLIELLLSGPSGPLEKAVRSAVPTSAAGPTKVTRTDGRLVVDLNQVGEQSAEQRQQIYQQVSNSLSSVFGQVQIQIDGQPLYADAPVMRPGKRTSAAGSVVQPADEDSGVVVAEDKVYDLDDQVPIPGPAGLGTYHAVTAGLSTDGDKLAVVGDTGRRPALWVGSYGESLRRMDIRARTLTQPSWGLRNPQGANSAGEVWTVVNGRRVVRLVGDQSGAWTQQSVDASALRKFGRLTQFRLCRDGTRFAAIAGGRLVVGAVQRDTDSVSLVGATQFGGADANHFVDVAWRDQAALVAVHNDAGYRVTEYSVDGLLVDDYENANLTPPLSAVTAAPRRPVVTMDTSGMWTYDLAGKYWRRQPSLGPNMVPSYPG